MFQEFLAQSQHLTWPLAALVVFFLVFLGVVVYVVRSMLRHQKFDHVASLPLEDDAPVEGEGGSKA